MIDGLVRGTLPPTAGASEGVVHVVAIAIICYAWARSDAVERGTVAPGRSALYAGFFPLLGVPAYLFRTRGLASGAVGTAKALVFVVAVAVLDGIVSYGVAALRH
jgi:hypothetical protein